VCGCFLDKKVRLGLIIMGLGLELCVLWARALSGLCYLHAASMFQHLIILTWVSQLTPPKSEYCASLNPAYQLPIPNPKHCCSDSCPNHIDF